LLFKAVGIKFSPKGGLPIKTAVTGTPREAIAIVKPIKITEAPLKPIESDSIFRLG
tara:strand:- start:113 stop:280 length:168 start_codon:yes stop_codon:yes gene_type:complete